MKYRIVAELCDDNKVYYSIQRKIFGIWFTYSLTDGWDFYTKTASRSIIDMEFAELIKKKPKVLASLITKSF